MQWPWCMQYKVIFSFIFFFLFTFYFKWTYSSLPALARICRNHCLLTFRGLNNFKKNLTYKYWQLHIICTLVSSFPYWDIYCGALFLFTLVATPNICNNIFETYNKTVNMICLVVLVSWDMRATVGAASMGKCTLEGTNIGREILDPESNISCWWPLLYFAQIYEFIWSFNWLVASV